MTQKACRTLARKSAGGPPASTINGVGALALTLKSDDEGKIQPSPPWKSREQRLLYRPPRVLVRLGCELLTEGSRMTIGYEYTSASEANAVQHGRGASS